MKIRGQRLPEVPGKPLRHPWGALGALQGAVGAVLVAPGATPPSYLLGSPGPAPKWTHPPWTTQTAPTTRPKGPKGPKDLTDQTLTRLF